MCIWAAQLLARLSLTYSNTASFILSGQFSQLSPDSPTLGGCLSVSLSSLSERWWMMEWWWKSNPTKKNFILRSEGTISFDALFGELMERRIGLKDILRACLCGSGQHERLCHSNSGASHWSKRQSRCLRNIQEDPKCNIFKGCDS